MDIKDLYDIFLKCGEVTTDSRVGRGIFFGIKGDNFNGADFADQALKNGAIYAVRENGLQVLQQLALYHRQHLKCPILAITGTNGKTTTKELIVSVLQKKYNIGYTKGNLNNHIGVPLTLLSFNDKTEIGIVEMGANHPLEIKQLCEIALPNLGLITNVGYAHLEGFGGFEGVVKTKGELYDFLRDNNSEVLFNSNNELLSDMVAKRDGLKAIPYSVDFESYIDQSGRVGVEYKSKKYLTNLVGLYNSQNIAAALAVGRCFKIPKELALEAICQYIPTNNRSQIIQTNRNTIVMDAYNANPSSMVEALNNFSQLESKNKIVILGDMRELGNYSSQEHLKISTLVDDLNFSYSILIGEEFFKINPLAYQSKELVIKELSKLSGATILIKGSRGMELEKLVTYL